MAVLTQIKERFKLSLLLSPKCKNFNYFLLPARMLNLRNITYIFFPFSILHLRWVWSPYWGGGWGGGKLAATTRSIAMSAKTCETSRSVSSRSKRLFEELELAQQRLHSLFLARLQRQAGGDVLRLLNPKLVGHAGLRQVLRKSRERRLIWSLEKHTTDLIKSNYGSYVPEKGRLFTNTDEDGPLITVIQDRLTAETFNIFILFVDIIGKDG